MIQKHVYKGTTWIDAVSPTSSEMQDLAIAFSLDSDVVHELLSPTLRPHTEQYATHLFLVLHFPTVDASEKVGTRREQEVDFIIGKDFLITVRYEAIDCFDELRQVFEMNASLEKEHVGNSPFDIFLLITRRLYKNVETELFTIHEKLTYIEKEIFDGYEKEMVIALSYAGRDILNLKQSLDPHQEILHSLAELTESFAGSAYVHRVRAIENIYYRARRRITRNWQTLNELRETNNSLLTTRQNDIMSKLTIMAFVTFPLMLLSSIFGMNTIHTPFIGSPYDFWIVIGLMAIATSIMFTFFRRKKWL